jgi:hypothetical protein
LKKISRFLINFLRYHLTKKAVSIKPLVKEEVHKKISNSIMPILEYQEYCAKKRDETRKKLLELCPELEPTLIEYEALRPNSFKEKLSRLKHNQ